ncbi:MAG: lamin tail domain-containing protein [Candidatus Latescibacteria bacterium]|nr:lamin tail domain-containing protein [Candidatus Latescibacterota bacterium]
MFLKITYITAICGFLACTQSLFANPLPEPIIISEFSTNPDWIEVYIYPGELKYHNLNVNGEGISILINSEPAIDKRFYFILDSSNTSGFDLPEEGGFFFFDSGDSLKYGILGVIPAPPAGESAATCKPYYYPDLLSWNIDPTPTPNAENDIIGYSYGKSPVFINEIYTDPSDKKAFVELFNISETSVDISGWSIISDCRYTVPPGTSISGKGFYVLTEPQFPLQFDMTQSSETVYLQNADYALVDQVGWSKEMQTEISMNRYPDGFAYIFDGYDTVSSVDFRIGDVSQGLPNEIMDFPTIASIRIEQESIILSPGSTIRLFCTGTTPEGGMVRILPEWRLEGDIGTIDTFGFATGIRCGEGRIVAVYRGMENSIEALGAIGGYLDSDTSWGPDISPLYVEDRFNVLSGVTLTIEPGVTIYFNGYYSFFINGSIEATGKPELPIVFTSGVSPSQPGDWRGIDFRDGTGIFENCEIRYSDEGILNTSNNENLIQPITVHMCFFSENNGAIHVESNAVITNNIVIGHPEGSGIESGIFVRTAESLKVSNNTVVDCICGLYIRNCAPVVENNIFYNCEYGIRMNRFDTANQSPDITYNNVSNFIDCPKIFGNHTTVNSTGYPSDIFFNISCDPLFVDSDNGDYRLVSGSPCIDAGNPGLQDGDGTISDMGAYGVRDVSVSGVDTRRNNVLPQEITLNQNFPNPFNPETTITFSLPEDKPVIFDIYSITGQKVRTLIDSFISGGVHSVIWDGKDDYSHYVSSGVYLYRLTSGNAVLTKRMIMIR